MASTAPMTLTSSPRIANICKNLQNFSNQSSKPLSKHLFTRLLKLMQPYQTNSSNSSLQEKSPTLLQPLSKEETLLITIVFKNVQALQILRDFKQTCYFPSQLPSMAQDLAKVKALPVAFLGTTAALYKGGIKDYVGKSFVSEAEKDAYFRIPSHPRIPLFAGIRKDPFSHGNDKLFLEHYGDDLQRVMKGSSDNPPKAFSSTEALQIASQLIEAVLYVHMHGFLYRKITPENILYDKEGIKLADFSLAYPLPENQNLSTCLPLCGIYEFFAPEQLKNLLTSQDPYSTLYSHQTDVWAIGCTLFEVLCKKTFFNLLSKSPITRAAPNATSAKQKQCHREAVTTLTKTWQQENLQTTIDALIDRECTNRPLLEGENLENTEKLVKLIKDCLRVNPEERISLESFKRYPRRAK